MEAVEYYTVFKHHIGIEPDDTAGHMMQCFQSLASKKILHEFTCGAATYEYASFSFRYSTGRLHPLDTDADQTDVGLSIDRMWKGYYPEKWVKPEKQLKYTKLILWNKKRLGRVLRNTR